MSAPNITRSAIPKQQANNRLGQIQGHMGSVDMNVEGVKTAFGADVVPQAPEDPLFGLMAAFKKDTDPKKVDLGIGAYRDDNAKPWVLPVVKEADDLLRKDPELNHEYLPIAGLQDFTSASQQLVLGKSSPAVQEKRAVSLQSVSGTGALHLGAGFLAKFYNPSNPEAKTIYVSSPTWANHNQVFGNSKVPVKTYPYFHKETKGLDFDGMISTLQSAPEGAIILLHACAHNPTGVDPTQDQWQKIAQVMKQKKQFPFFDCAYQGFA
ncbi:aspartate aminotransferase, partial [Hortaea werneckii]